MISSSVVGMSGLGVVCVVQILLESSYPPMCTSMVLSTHHLGISLGYSDTQSVPESLSTGYLCSTVTYKYQ